MPPAFRPPHPVFAAEANSLDVRPVHDEDTSPGCARAWTSTPCSWSATSASTDAQALGMNQREKIRFRTRRGTRRAILLAIAAVESSELAPPGQ